MRRVAWQVVGAALGILVMASAGTSTAITLPASSVIEIDTPDGTVSLLSRVEEIVGDPSRWLVAYELSGTWNPDPGVSNGISSLQIYFGGLLDDVSDQSAPPGWLLNCCFSLPPFGVGFDLPNAAGVGEGGSAIFSFQVPAGTGFTRESQGAFVTSYVDGIPSGDLVLLENDAGEGPIVPVPEPGTLALLALGLGALRRVRA